MKRIIESNSLSDCLMSIKKVLNEESDAIKSYDEILGMSGLPSSVRPIIEEIREDEKDHLVLLTNLLQDLVEDELPNNGEEDVGMIPIVDDDDES